ncbi:MAG: NAD-dependent epimerase/dehydratase family protein [Cytophagales bacterium]|nr:NAD-dependent epimerase/dehydratase family protein [Cytophagales bacterium]
MARTERVLVTGANGLLGANVVRWLNGQKRYEAVAMVRRGCNMRALEGLEYELFEGMITEFRDLDEIMASCDYVVHCAALTAVQSRSFDEFCQVNVESTRRILELCEKHRLKRMIFVSTANCFTNGTLEKPGDETGGFMPWLRRSPYAYSKYLAQELVLQAARDGKVSVLVVAPTFMIGARDGSPSSGRLLLYCLKAPVVFYPPGGKSFVDVEHASEAIGSALEKGRSGELYMLSGANLTYKAFFREALHLVGRRKLLFPIPSAFFTLVAKAGKLYQKLGGRRVLLDETAGRLLCLENYFSNNKARRELEMPETDLKKCLKSSYEWFKKNNYL